ncbi:MAG: 2-phospho-L-lactate transferase [Chloroflexi bacterium]|nr:2-phospho-L-lactate transferase [Chloroflexota bacterium]
MIVVLAGGVGAARFLEGVITVVPPDQVTVISNTGDDIDFYGLRVCPDVDIVTYTLAGRVDAARGWGLLHDTFHVVGALRRFDPEVWFNLGDHDLSTCLYRTAQLAAGRTLTEVTAAIVAAHGLAVRLLPMTDARVETRVQTPGGELAFQEYFVHRRTEDDVLGVRFAGIEGAAPAPGVLEAIKQAEAVLIAPSNPFVSIGPILAVPGVRDALRQTAAPVVAVSPIIGGESVKGPAAKMMRTLGHEASATRVALLYQDFLDTLVLDNVDAALASRVEAAGMRAVVTDTIMRGRYEKAALARIALEAGREKGKGKREKDGAAP